MHAAKFLEQLFADPPTTIVAAPIGAKPTSPEARASEPTRPDDVRAVGRPDAPAGPLGDGQRECGGLLSGADMPSAEPAPCPRCGNPAYWLLPGGGTSCGNCRSRPEGVPLTAIVITLPDDRWAWEVEPVDAWKTRRKSVLSIHAGIR